MLAAERYKSVWNMFLQALNHDPTACLRAFQCEQHVNKRSMARWMQNNGLSVRKAKTLLHESKKSADKQMPPSDSMFLPITADFTLSHKDTSDMLYGVCFTFPDGTQVNIKRGTAEAVISMVLNGKRVFVFNNRPQCFCVSNSFKSVLIPNIRLTLY